MSIKPGYWRANKNSSIIYVCNKLLNSCNGGDSENLCSKSYTGVKCEVCIMKNSTEILQRSFSGRCLPCPSIGGLIVLIFAMIIVLGLVISLITIKFSNKKSTFSTLITMKVLIGYLQNLLIIQSYNISIPAFFSESLSASNTVSQLVKLWFSMECILKLLTPSGYSTHLESLIVFLATSLILPTAIIFLNILPIKKKLIARGIIISNS